MIENYFLRVSRCDSNTQLMLGVDKDSARSGSLLQSSGCAFGKLVQSDAQSPSQRFWMVLVATLFVATLLILSQFIILSYGMVSSWKWWWLLL